MATILIIEDDPNTVRLLEISLRPTGHKTVVALDGFQALKLVRTSPPDLILLDLMLPGIDGFEFCNRLRADPATADLPVIIVTAKSQDADRQMAAKVGANGFFVKPYPRTELMDAIQALLTKKSRATRSPGIGVAFVAARDNQTATHVVVNTALALASAGESVTLADLRPYSVEHCSLLNVASRPAPVNPARAPLADLLVLHPSGLRLLNNLEGSGDVGQITPADARAALEAMLAGGGYSLVDLPLYPIELMREISIHCALVALVTAFDPPSVGPARSALTMMERIGLGSEQTGLVLIGAGDARDRPDLGRVVLATLPASAGADHPEFQALTARLRGLRKA